jgi:hypothetical protein
LLACRFYKFLGANVDQPNTKLNHAKDPLEVPNGPITRAKAKKFKEALNGLVQNIYGARWT